MNCSGNVSSHTVTPAVPLPQHAPQGCTNTACAAGPRLQHCQLLPAQGQTTDVRPLSKEERVDMRSLPRSTGKEASAAAGSWLTSGLCPRSPCAPHSTHASGRLVRLCSTGSRAHACRWVAFYSGSGPQSLQTASQGEARPRTSFVSMLHLGNVICKCARIICRRKGATKADICRAVACWAGCSCHAKQGGCTWSGSSLGGGDSGGPAGGLGGPPAAGGSCGGWGPAVPSVASSAALWWLFSALYICRPLARTLMAKKAIIRNRTITMTQSGTDRVSTTPARLRLRTGRWHQASLWSSQVLIDTQYSRASGVPAAQGEHPACAGLRVRL